MQCLGASTETSNYKTVVELGHLGKRQQDCKWSEVAQLCPTLCNPVDCSPPGSSVHGIFQARVLEWVAISFSSRIANWEIKTLFPAFSGYHGVGNYEQQSLPRHPLRGGAESPAREPAQAQKVFGDGGASDQPEELWPSEGQTLLGHRQA